MVPLGSPAAAQICSPYISWPGSYSSACSTSCTGQLGDARPGIVERGDQRGGGMIMTVIFRLQRSPGAVRSNWVITPCITRSMSVLDAARRRWWASYWCRRG
jgi:hypothetical protein